MDIRVMTAEVLWFFQNEPIPENLWEIAKDFPVLILFMGALYYFMKWGERMLEAQRVGLKEVYEAQRAESKEVYVNNQDFLRMLLDDMKEKQDQIDDHIKMLAKEVSYFRGTLEELAKIDDVIDRLLGEIRARK